MNTSRWEVIEKQLDNFHSLISPEMPRLKIERGCDYTWTDEEYEEKKPPHFPKKCRGVYLLYDVNETLLYVGLALNGFDYRVWGHKRKYKSCRYIDFIKFSDKYAFLSPSLEYFLISCLSPSKNSIWSEHELWVKMDGLSGEDDS